MEDTDGCSKQYRSASSLYLISTICMKYGIVIDHAVGALRYIKDVVDGLNAVDKRVLRTAMLRNSIPEEHTNSAGAFYNTMQSMFLMYGHQSQ
eukprot:5430562-Ditylum_brightwellii.AAC.1